ncbi:hypothetical protein BDF22DRAFT_663607 [Syncephalis plumigaleata]|nr:hypothetical protein BDF22DRAFT_663607 [Syncephalis plumigaleata]
MCILFLYHTNSTDEFPWKLVLADNRDEVVARPTQPAHLWPETASSSSSSSSLSNYGVDQLLAAKDLIANGTWLGMTLKGRLSTLTNRPPASPSSANHHKATMGSVQNVTATTTTTTNILRNLVADYLQYRTTSDTRLHDMDGHLYLESIQREQDNYAGFNLLVGNALLNRYWIFSHSPDANTNHNGHPDNLITSLSLNTPHVISNAAYPYFDRDIWPKITAGQTNFDRIINVYKKEWQSNSVEISATTTESFARQLFDMLGDRQCYPPSDEAMKNRLVNQNNKHTRWHVFVSPLGKLEAFYATRTSTVILVDHQNNVTFAERNFDYIIDGANTMNDIVLHEMANRARVFQFQLADYDATSMPTVNETYWQDLPSVNIL